MTITKFLNYLNIEFLVRIISINENYSNAKLAFLMSRLLLLVEVLIPLEVKQSGLVWKLCRNRSPHSRCLLYSRVFNSNYNHESKHLEMTFSHM